MCKSSLSNIINKKYKKQSKIQTICANLGPSEQLNQKYGNVAMNCAKIHTTKNDRRSRPHNSKKGGINRTILRHHFCRTWEYLQVTKGIIQLHTRTPLKERSHCQIWLTKNYCHCQSDSSHDKRRSQVKCSILLRAAIGRQTR